MGAVHHPGNNLSTNDLTPSLTYHPTAHHDTMEDRGGIQRGQRGTAATGADGAARGQEQGSQVPHASPSAAIHVTVRPRPAPSPRDRRNRLAVDLGGSECRPTC